MDLKPDKKTVSELFPLELDITYEVPVYQRNYSWKEENIETLIQDILEEPQGYYLGNIIVTEYSDKENYFDIVDGQQRVTTIALILLATFENLSESLKSRKLNEQLIEESSAIKSRIKDKLLKTDSNPKLSLLAPDNMIYGELLNLILKGDKNSKPHKNKVFGKRYDYTKKLIKSKFYGEEELDEEKYNLGTRRLLEFYNKLNYAEILRIRVPNLNDAFNVFTSFNAKGVPLTLIDLFKSFYLRETSNFLTKQEAVKKWEELISLFYNENDEIIPSVVSQFLLNNYDTFESTSKASITQNSALNIYDKIFSEKGHTYIDNLIIRGKIFTNMSSKVDSINILNLNKVTQKKLLYLDKLESTQAYPVIFYLLNKYYEDKITVDLINDFFDFLIIYFVRRNIILKPKASNIRSKSIQSIRKLADVENVEEINIKQTKEYFLSIAANEEEFKVALEGSVYLNSKNATRIILIYLERKYGTFFNKQVTDSLDSITDKGSYIWTLEHIMPQSAERNKDWKDILLKKTSNEDQIALLLENHVHKIGNLTLTGYNSGMSSKSFVDKKNYRDPSTNAETGLKTNLFLNDSIFGDYENKDTKNEWTLEDIDARTKFLTEKTLALFGFNI